MHPVKPGIEMTAPEEAIFIGQGDQFSNTALLAYQGRSVAQPVPLYIDVEGCSKGMVA